MSDKEEKKYAQDLGASIPKEIFMNIPSRPLLLEEIFPLVSSSPIGHVYSADDWEKSLKETSA